MTSAHTHSSLCLQGDSAVWLLLSASGPSLAQALEGGGGHCGNPMCPCLASRPLEPWARVEAEATINYCLKAELASSSPACGWERQGPPPPSGCGGHISRERCFSLVLPVTSLVLVGSVHSSSWALLSQTGTARPPCPP